MLRPCIKPRKQRPGLGRDHRCFVILSCESAHCFYGVKPHDGDELHLISQIAPQQVNPPISSDLKTLYALNDLSLEQRLVGVSIGWLSPPMPYLTVHIRILPL